MNIVNRLTVRCLKMNKRRTLVTIIGIILSVSMLTAISTILFSFMDLMQRDTAAKYGEWHASLSGVEPEKLSQVEQAENVKTVLLVRNLGFSQFKESQNDNMPFFYIEEYNTPAFTHFHRKLVAGRLPQRVGEAVVSQDALNAGAPFQIGDTVTFPLGYRVGSPGGAGQEIRLSTADFVDRNPDGSLAETFELRGEERTYTITGILESGSGAYFDEMVCAYPVIGYCDEASIAAEGALADPMLVFDPVRRSLYQEVEDLAQATGAADYKFNGSLLRFYGLTSRDSLQGSIILFAAILLAVVLIGSAMLIYNAFSISVAERSRYLGMLASVGATRRQKRSSVYFEGFLLGVIAIPIGLLAGIGGIGVTFALMNTALRDALGLIVDVRLVVSVPSVLLAVLLSALMIFFSVWQPARRASRTMPIDAIRQAKEVKLSGRAVRTSRLTRRLFGFEGEVALKNLKRNRGRYRATLLSLTVSVVLFLTVSFGVQLVVTAYGLEEERQECDLIVMPMGLESQQREELYRRILAEGQVTQYTIADEMWFETVLPQEKITADFFALSEPVKMPGGYDVSVSVLILEDASFAAYAEQIGVDVADYADPKQRKAILVNRATRSVMDEEKQEPVTRQYELLNLRRGEKLLLERFYEEEAVSFGAIQVEAVTEQYPFGISETYGGALLVVPEQTGRAMREAYAQRLTGMERQTMLESSPILYLNSEHPEQVRKIIGSYNTPGLSEQVVYNDYVAQREEMEHVILLISVFSGGFIALITLICMANMFNTISTSMALRRREFAMLQSAGMTPKGFRRMIRFESLFYALKTLLYGLPVSFCIMALLQLSLGSSIEVPFQMPWIPLLCAVAGVLVIVGLTMLYASAKLKKENMIDMLKDENI
ncbi:MAG TPA: ABC transporter permease [Candidatus Fimivicinus intestinavium]|nr:ABC transporter permease [Candidatus Fimivicinus intestinavium]